MNAVSSPNAQSSFLGFLLTGVGWVLWERGKGQVIWKCNILFPREAFDLLEKQDKPMEKIYFFNETGYEKLFEKCEVFVQTSCGSWPAGWPSWTPRLGTPPLMPELASGIHRAWQGWWDCCRHLGLSLTHPLWRRPAALPWGPPRSQRRGPCGALSSRQPERNFAPGSEFGSRSTSPK